MMLRKVKKFSEIKEEFLTFFKKKNMKNFEISNFLCEKISSLIPEILFFNLS